MTQEKLVRNIWRPRVDEQNFHRTNWEFNRPSSLEISIKLPSTPLPERSYQNIGMISVLTYRCYSNTGLSTHNTRIPYFTTFRTDQPKSQVKIWYKSLNWVRTFIQTSLFSIFVTVLLHVWKITSLKWIKNQQKSCKKWIIQFPVWIIKCKWSPDQNCDQFDRANKPRS